MSYSNALLFLNAIIILHFNLQVASSYPRTSLWMVMENSQWESDTLPSITNWYIEILDAAFKKTKKKEWIYCRGEGMLTSKCMMLCQALTWSRTSTPQRTKQIYHQTNNKESKKCPPLPALKIPFLVFQQRIFSRPLRVGAILSVIRWSPSGLKGGEQIAGT